MVRPWQRIHGSILHNDGYCREFDPRSARIQAGKRLLPALTYFQHATGRDEPNRGG